MIQKTCLRIKFRHLSGLSCIHARICIHTYIHTYNTHTHTHTHTVLKFYAFGPTPVASLRLAADAFGCYWTDKHTQSNLWTSLCSYVTGHFRIGVASLTRPMRCSARTAVARCSKATRVGGRHHLFWVRWSTYCAELHRVCGQPVRSSCNATKVSVCSTWRGHMMCCRCCWCRKAQVTYEMSCQQ